MEITDVRVSLRDDDKLKSFVTLTFDGCFVLRGVKVIEGHKGLFVAMPARRNRDGSYDDIAHPIHAPMRQRIGERVLAEYRTVREQAEAPAGR